MSELSTQPVFTCKRCSVLYTVSHLSTAFSDPDGAELRRFMNNLKKIGYCPTCLQIRNWYIEQGRVEDFEAGRP